ncbi:hypothetical protein ACR3S7_000979 [Campylobacter lari]|uniref:Uncharacterized protein n=1 Tax=Campylobacter lari TaxID=201 RepID=A0A5L4NM57_CAMLA|nr:hypothetical protein [Campylobacter sp. CNRCH_2013_0898h]EAI3905402.1 hypothetical protein [Campylobacter lari]EAI3913794.1 hypothetical protein [Campylobacter lari]EAI4447580.1 hypothetical protein [Campylobacter lari]EAI4449624.1 hypothetical protein [Campylobacter lari]EAJ6187937.1 hypothetical protein [Campylobacter lari]
MCSIDKEQFDGNISLFYGEIKNGNNHRYLSWEHCYEYFYIYRKDIDYDYASLMLSFYLASWGMYRGSSFLLRHDYKIYKTMLEELLTIDLWDKHDWSQIIKANEIIERKLSPYKNNKEDKNNKNKISNTLITKILLGIFGCTPAYDRFFVNGLKKYNINNNKIPIQYCKDSYMGIMDLIDRCKSSFEFPKIKLKFNENIYYPDMKIMDMYFWVLGKE